MQEIDDIIINSLRHLEYDLPEDVTSLKQFETDHVLGALSTCLEAIKGGDVTFPKRFPPNMTQKLKIASDVATEIKNVGFRGDLGYQTILYANEVEVRRVLMFLIERLPRIGDKSLKDAATVSGLENGLIKDIEKTVKTYMNCQWLPTQYLYNGLRDVNNGFIINSFGHSRLLDSCHLSIPDSSCQNDDVKYYNVHIVPEVTQLPPHKLIPSLLFDSDYKIERNEITNKYLQQQLNPAKLTVSNDLLLKLSPSKRQMTTPTLDNCQTESTVEIVPEKTELEQKMEVFESERIKFDDLQKSVNESQENLNKLQETFQKEQEALKAVKNDLKVKQRTVILTTDPTKMDQLQDRIELLKNRMGVLQLEWQKVKEPLLEEYNRLQSTVSEDAQRQQQTEAQLSSIRNLKRSLVTDLKHKEALENALSEKMAQLNRVKSTRFGYTQRILEIIGNIRKQNAEIDRILADTREIQREINNLTGQVDRSFTLADELIFHDAKQDETARRAYKLLAMLRDECGAILTAVSELGQVERELRNIQEQIDVEKAKDVENKLDQVVNDLNEIRKEIKRISAQ